MERLQAADTDASLPVDGEARAQSNAGVSVPERGPNSCAGRFGAVYSACIERPIIARAVGHVVWGIDLAVLYRSIALVSRLRGVTIADVPCGGGVALRALSPSQDVRYRAGDLDSSMLRRTERRARRCKLGNVEVISADMTDLPFDDSEIDVFLSYGGLHMVHDGALAVAEIARCLKPGGLLMGTSFFDDISLRARFLFERARSRGHPVPPARESLYLWLREAGFVEASLGPEYGFTTFRARRSLLPTSR